MDMFHDNLEVLKHFGRLIASGLSDESGAGWEAIMVTYPDGKLYPELAPHIGHMLVMFDDGSVTVSKRAHLESFEGYRPEDSRLNRR